MTSYIIKRLVLLIPLLLGITLVSFVLLKSLPGDIALSLVGERASQETIDSIRKEIGADKDALHQYAGYLKMLARGDLGRSYYTGRDVLSDIARKFPNTMKLAFAAMAISVPLGIMAGFAAAYRKGGPVGKMIDALSLAGLSVPVFWSAIMIMVVFSLRLKMFPPSGTGNIRFLVLPACALSIPAAATLVRVTRTVVAEVLAMPFIRTATAKGLPPARIKMQHVLRNAIIPIITIIGLDFGSYLNGAVVTETIFGWDGIGRFTMEGIMKRDYPVIMGCIIAGTVVFVMVNLLVDVLYHYLDPRIRLHANDK
ncbi:MAG: ABC transporter permease [Nitrospirae bacterium]|nr:ABC transporter permease [Nitrospirota bacterium]